MSASTTLGSSPPPLRERFEACLLLHAVGDAVGYRGGQWEFCASTGKIRSDCEALGGVLGLDLKNWMVSDDTVEHLAMAEGLLAGLGKLPAAERRQIICGGSQGEGNYDSDAGGRRATSTASSTLTRITRLANSREEADIAETHAAPGTSRPPQQLLVAPPPVGQDPSTATASSSITTTSKSKSIPLLDKLLASIARCFKRAGDDFTGRAPGKGEQQGIKLLQNTGENWDAKPFDSRSGGCGAAMRTPVFGLVSSFESMLALSIEASRMSKTVPAGFLGGFVASYFTYLAVYERERTPVRDWVRKLLNEGLPAVDSYLLSEQGPRPRHMKELRGGGFFPLRQSEFGKKWEWYAESVLPGILEDAAKSSGSSGTTSTNNDMSKNLSDQNGFKAMDSLYMEISKNSFNTSGKFPGSCGCSSVLIAYDALVRSLHGTTGKGGPRSEAEIGGKTRRELMYKTLVERSALHRGDSDSTGSVALAWYGALFGFCGVPERHYAAVEYAGRCRNAGKNLVKIMLEVAPNKSADADAAVASATDLDDAKLAHTTQKKKHHIDPDA